MARPGRAGRPHRAKRSGPEDAGERIELVPAADEPVARVDVGRGGARAAPGSTRASCPVPGQAAASPATVAGSIHSGSQTWPSRSTRLRLYMKP